MNDMLEKLLTANLDTNRGHDSQFVFIDWLIV